MLRITVGGAGYELDASAISCVRYRSLYGSSPVMDFINAPEESSLPVMIRIIHTMIRGERPGLRDFAFLARETENFRAEALRAITEGLLRGDGKTPQTGKGSREELDEFLILAVMSELAIPAGLLYELPILQLIGVINRAIDLKNPQEKKYHRMDVDEMAALYPRRPPKVDSKRDPRV